MLRAPRRLTSRKSGRMDELSPVRMVGWGGGVSLIMAWTFSWTGCWAWRVGMGQGGKPKCSNQGGHTGKGGMEHSSQMSSFYLLGAGTVGAPASEGRTQLPPQLSTHQPSLSTQTDWSCWLFSSLYWDLGRQVTCPICQHLACN